MMIQQVFVIALFTLGYCCTFWQGMIFEKLGDIIQFFVPGWLWKIIGGCYICACMWIGSLVYVVLYRNSFVDWFITCVAAMGVNCVVSFLSSIGETKEPI